MLGSSALVNTSTFSGENFMFSKFSDQGETECKNHDLTIEQLQNER